MSFVFGRDEFDSDICWPDIGGVGRKKAEGFDVDVVGCPDMVGVDGKLLQDVV